MFQDVPLSQKVYLSLKEKIINNSIKPGAKLSEATIAKKMGISRTPVREALRKLVDYQFATMRPNLGIAVNDISIEDVVEVMQLRGVLEGLAARIAAIVISKEEIKVLENCVNKMKIYRDENNVSEYFKLNKEFHEIILNTCRNKRLREIHKNLEEQILGFRQKSLNIPERIKHSFNDHQQILEALRKNNSVEADSLSQRHVKNALKRFIDKNIFSI